MDITAIAASATQMSQARTANDVQLTIFRKALNLQAQGAAQLIDAAVQATPVNPPSLGSRIDTFA